MNPLLLTDADVMECLRLPARAVDRLRRSGQLPCVVVEGHRRYRRQDVEAFVTNLSQAAAPQQAPVLEARRLYERPKRQAEPDWQPRLVGKKQRTDQRG